MRSWWHQSSLCTRLTVLFTSVGVAAGLLCSIVALVLDVWKPVNGLRILLVLAIGAFVSTLVFVITGYFIAGRLLAPLREMAERTRQLSAKTLSERLPVANPYNELGHLAAGFNDVLQQLESSFAELDRLTADVSHELRTPLTAMRAVGEVALRERNPAVLYDAVGSMLEEIGRMNQLIDRLLLLARADNNEMPVHLEAGLVRNVLVEVSDALSLVAEEKQQRIEVDCADHVLAVFDPALLRLALMNLTQNAIRYSPLGKPIVLRGVERDGGIVIEVIDKGPGISAAHHQKIFERFYRVDKARSRTEGGVGLGLAIVRWAAERMGGTVELDSEVGRGSVFCLRLRPVGP